MDCLRRQGLKDAERRFKPIMKRTFACREDVYRSQDEVMRRHRDSAYNIVADMSDGHRPKEGFLRTPSCSSWRS